MGRNLPLNLRPLDLLKGTGHLKDQEHQKDLEALIIQGRHIGLQGNPIPETPPHPHQPNTVVMEWKKSESG